MRKPIIQVGGAIMTGVLSAIGTALDIAGITGNAPVILRWLSLVILLLFFGFVTWAWYDMRRKIQEYEDERPSVTVVPEVKSNRVLLHIKNNGGAAKFIAQARVAKESGTYELPWSDQLAPERTLFHNGTATLFVGARYFAPNDAQKPYIGLHYGSASAEFQSFCDQGTELQVEIEITSAPPLREAFCHPYNIKLGQQYT